MTGNKDFPYSQAFSTGLLIPTAWCNIASEFIGVFSKAPDMCLGNSLNLKTSFSKEVAENFAVGVAAGAGYLWGIGTDWTLVFDIGATYKVESLGVFKNMKFGASILNLGKVYNKNDAICIKDYDIHSEWDTYPSFLMIKVGASCLFVESERFNLGASLDVSTPFFQNYIIDTALQMNMFKYFNVNVAWQFDMQHAMAGFQSYIPSVTLSYKIGLNTSFTNKKDWEKSDLQIGTAYKHMGKSVGAFSCGAIVTCGQPDKKAPTIQINAEVEE